MSNNILFYLLIALIIIAGAYLTVKATYENNWDGWGFGSAQTMTTIKHWVKDGWATHYFLFTPAGYSKTTRYFDNLALKHHAWVEVTGIPGEKRVYYTRYPSGYLFPSAFLMELGVEKRFWFRFFQILISLGSLLLLYKFFNLISNKIIAFSATLFYLISVPFLNFADSLANMPIDDLFRFLILFLSILALRHIKNAKKYNFHNFWIWLAYFILSVSSYDSTLFIFAWLIGLDIIVKWPTLRGLNIKEFILRNLSEGGKKWLFFASAPLLAFALQIIQNSWYLGFTRMYYDFLSAFNKIAFAADVSQGFIQQRFLLGILYPLTEAFAFSLRARYIVFFIIAILIVLFFLNKKEEIKNLIHNQSKYLFLLGTAGFFQSLILTQNTAYKGRLLGVFASLLIGMFIFISIKLIKNKLTPRILTLALFSLTAFMLFLQTNRTLAYIQQWPNNTYDPKIIDFAKKLKNTIQPFRPKDIVIFSMFPPQSYNHEAIPSAMAVYYDMYYHDAPLIYFSETKSMVRDFNYLKQISKYPFSALMIMKDKNQTSEFIQLLQKTSSQFDEKSIKTFIVQNKYILLISP